MAWFNWFQPKDKPPTPKLESEPKLLNLEQFALENDDLITGWSLFVTMSRRTPLAWLLRHGEYSASPTELPQQHAIWMPVTKSFRDLGIDVDEIPPGNMASEIGPVLEDGGAFLPFLVSYRQIVENETSRTEMLNDLTALSKRHPDIADRLGGDIAKQFVMTEFLSLNGCGKIAAGRLYEAGYRSATEVQATTSQKLCSIKGLGLKTVEKMLAS